MKAPAILGLCLGALLALAPAAGASVRCREVAATQTLRVLPYEDDRADLDFAAATVRREGDRILVFDPAFEEARRAVTCEGPPATIFNTATILFIQSGLSFTTLDLAGGLPAPHTEFRSDLGALGYGFVKGTAAPDVWAFGGTPRAVGLNLDPARPEELPVTWGGLGVDVAIAEPGAGNDTVDATGVLRRKAITFAEGGAGDDTLLGSRFQDALTGGAGRDLLEGGGGSDLLDGRDRDHDRLDCGGGKDKAQPGRGDSVLGCEKVDPPGHRHRHRPPRFSGPG